VDDGPKWGTSLATPISQFAPMRGYTWSSRMYTRLSGERGGLGCLPRASKAKRSCFRNYSSAGPTTSTTTSASSPGQRPYFLGPFVYHDVRPGVRFLVDGQQRFTVLHLVFIHLYRQAQALGRRDTEDALNRVIRFTVPGSGWHFRIDIEERRKALQAWYRGNDFQPDLSASLSLRNLSARSDELGELLEDRLEAGDLSRFVEWLLARVILVGIRAPDRDSGFRIFESMNDRGTRLTPVDLLKSFLLSRVREGEEDLNLRWRSMLIRADY
jgi:hypothetical protein